MSLFVRLIEDAAIAGGAALLTLSLGHPEPATIVREEHEIIREIHDLPPAPRATVPLPFTDSRCFPPEHTPVPMTESERSSILQIRGDVFVISHAATNKTADCALADLSTTVRIVPYFEGGRPMGFRLYSIQPGGLLALIGLMN